MAYIGRDTDKLSNIEVLDAITFDGSSSYTLQKNSVNFTPSSANNVLVSIDGVVQANNFTVSGSTIDFGVAVPGTSTCDWIYHIGVGLITTPADGTVTTGKLADGAVTSAKLASGAIANTPAFIATASADQSISNNTVVKVTFDTEELDTDNAFASNKFTVPTGKAGKYLIHSAVRLETSTDTNLEIYIYKNGSEIIRRRNFNGSFDFSQVTQILDLADADYLEIYVKHEAGIATNISGGTTDPVRSMFQGYKLIGV